MATPLIGLSPINLLDTKFNVLDDVLVSQYKGILPTDILQLKKVSIKVDPLAISAFNKLKSKIISDTIEVIQDPGLPDPGESDSKDNK